MGYDLIGRNGKELGINAKSSMWLTKLTAAWWPKLGIPSTINSHDCSMLARVISNYVDLQSIIDENSRKVIGWEKEDDEELVWLISAARFFRSCAGCARNDG